ncbi:hypothetical protein DL764_004593 [Monosporascus ibericus]|uniref:F-box domain-containing protein n=1 Tax=Monosporascus ibericus TaxID=155417 RepID=A0A4Q4TEW8_9PEZI|nr:hypothetical protein DL764_004593 [Monosporascus ibericus]
MSTANQPVSAHARTLLDVPEILEEILMHLGMRTLLTSVQGVNKTLYRLIAGSPPLQQRLLFRADYSTTSTPNPLMEEFPFYFTHLRLGSGEQAPLLAKTGRAWNNALRSPSAEHIRAKGQAFGRPGATWRRMLVQQPPLPASGKSALSCPWATFA